MLASTYVYMYGIVIIWVWVAVIPWGAQLWVMLHVPPKRPYFFRSLSPKDPHFYQLSPNDPLFLTNSLSPKDPDTSLSLKDPSFSHWIVKQVNSWPKQNWIFKNFDKFDEMSKHFWPFWPWRLNTTNAVHCPSAVSTSSNNSLHSINCMKLYCAINHKLIMIMLQC